MKKPPEVKWVNGNWRYPDGTYFHYNVKHPHTGKGGKGVKKSAEHRQDPAQLPETPLLPFLHSFQRQIHGPGNLGTGHAVIIPHPDHPAVLFLKF